MTPNDLIVLVPCHSLEDFPTELGEKPAEGLLNAFAVLWHPYLLATSDSIPRWARADEPLEVRPGGVVIVPSQSTSLVPTAWIERARREGMHVVSDIGPRRELLREVLAPLAGIPDLDSDLVADFLAFGHLHLQTELLTRQMRQFDGVDPDRLRKEAVAGAKALIAGDGDACRTHLKHAFELLLEARERFYPVNCFLIDLCLVIPSLAGEPLCQVAAGEVPTSLLATARDWEQICGESPETQAAVRDAWEAGRVEIVGGEYAEDCAPLLALEAALADLRRGRSTLNELFGQAATTWGRRRYGLSPLLPQLLKRSGFDGSLHFVMDDGIYPDDEYAKLLWQGSDGSAIPSYSRIPLAAESASAMLRFPIRMAESMDSDHVAGLVLAHWPERRSPWLDDFRRGARYAPSLGRFVTFRDFFAETDFDGRMSEFREGTYLSPFLVQAVARRESLPLSRYIDYWRRHRLAAGIGVCTALTQLIRTGRIEEDGESLRRTVAAAGPDVPPGETSGDVTAKAADDTLANAASAAKAEFSRTLMRNALPQPGVLVFNPVGFGRSAIVDWPADLAPPAAEGPVVARQFDAERRRVVVKTPPCGYVWIPAVAGEQPPPPSSKAPTAEGLLVRNEFFEASLSETTGGLAQIRTYGRGQNRLSQQLAWRFPREKSLPLADARGEPARTWYSEMRLRESRVLCTGPALGAVEAIGDLIDPTNGKLSPRSASSYALARRGYLELEIEIGVEKTPEGDPWTNYIASRFAWSDAALSISRSLQGSTQLVRDEQRIESPGFIELASEAQRTTILTGGLSFHRVTGPRMLDTLLVVEGETRRRFQFAITLDHSFPEEAAMDVEVPLLSMATTHGPPPAGAAGWLLKLSARNVQLREILPLAPSSADSGPAQGCIVRLQETEGKNRNFSIAAFRPITQARQLDFKRDSLHSFRIENGAAQVSIAPYELCDVELRFG
ncbi:MAG: hypothetical protein R3B90_10660 [Planctomycetaceae bacterium]